MSTFCEAIARKEGFYVAGSRANRNHNPGNIVWGDFARQHGADRIEAGTPQPRFAHFPDDATGFAAMRALLHIPAVYEVDHRDLRHLLRGYWGATVAEVIAKWAPPSENDTAKYIRDVCDWAGCKPGDELAGVL